MVTYTTTDFIAAVKLVAHFPEGNNTFQPADILTLADLAMRTTVAPKIASVREAYWQTTLDQDIDNDVNEYPVPALAQGEGLVDVKIKQGELFIQLARLEISELYSTQFSTRPAYGYYMEDNLVKLLPATLPGVLRMWYYRLPSELVLPTACAQITAVDYNANSVTVNSVPASFTGQELDISSAQPGFNVQVKDSTPVSIVGPVITFQSIPSRVQVGDWVSLSGQACVIQCPLEWIEVLVQAVVCKVYEIQGYRTKLADAKKALEEMITATIGLVNPRVTQKGKQIVGGGSLLQPMNTGWRIPPRG